MRMLRWFSGLTRENKVYSYTLFSILICVTLKHCSRNDFKSRKNGKGFIQMPWTFFKKRKEKCDKINKGNVC